MSHSLLRSFGYSKTLTTQMTMNAHDTHTDSNTNADINSVPFPTASLPDASNHNSPDNDSSDKPLPPLPARKGSSPGSLLRHFRQGFKKAVKKAAHPFRRSRNSASAQGSGSFDDSGYSSHTNIRTTESPNAVATATLGPPPGLVHPSQRVTSIAFAGPSSPSVSWLSQRRVEQAKVVNNGAYTRTPYPPSQDSLMGSLLSPAGSPDLNMAVSAVPPRPLATSSCEPEPTDSIPAPAPAPAMEETESEVQMPHRALTQHHRELAEMVLKVGREITNAYQALDAHQASVEVYHAVGQHLLQMVHDIGGREHIRPNPGTPAFEGNVADQPASPSASNMLETSPESAADAEALKGVSKTEAESSDTTSNLPMYYPLHSMNLSERRLTCLGTGARFKRYTDVWRLDPLGHRTDAFIRFTFLGSLSDDNRGKNVYAAIAKSDHPTLAHFPTQVAIKMMSKQEMFDGTFQSFLDYPTTVWEAQSMRRLSEAGSRFTAGALAIFQDVDYLYIVSRWYYGSLQNYIREKTSVRLLGTQSQRYIMDIDTFSFYAGELLLAMEELRDAHMIHGDIKTDNVFVTPSGHFVLADFDRAHPNVLPGMRAQHKEYEDVRISHANGTAMYMAPEFDHDPLTNGVTPRADMWSLGVVLLEFALQTIEPFFWQKFKPRLLSDGDWRALVRILNESDWKLRRHEARTLWAELDNVVFDFIAKLLVVDPTQRLTIAQAKEHPLFQEMNWDALRAGTIPPPLVVELGNEMPDYSSHIKLHNLPKLSPTTDPEIMELQKRDVLTFSEFGYDWIAPQRAYAVKGGPQHGRVYIPVPVPPEVYLSEDLPSPSA